MKEAPDKIYLQENSTTDLYSNLWPEWFEAKAKDTDICYIRKDALMEWAKKKRESIVLTKINLDKIGVIDELILYLKTL